MRHIVVEAVGSGAIGYGDLHRCGTSHVVSAHPWPERAGERNGDERYRLAGQWAVRACLAMSRCQILVIIVARPGATSGQRAL
jgi:hypothetical protein